MNRHVRYKEGLRIALESAKPSKDVKAVREKYVDTKADTQASAFVASYRRVRNIINAYVVAADKQINTLQSIKKGSEQDVRNTNLSKQNQ